MESNLTKKRFVRVGSFEIGEDEKNAVMSVLNSGRISEGPQVREFEKLFAEYVGTKFCVAVSSGTAALIISLLALIYDERFPKIKKGSKVITSPVTYISTVNAIVLAGLEPVFVDIDPQDFTLNTDQIESLLQNAAEEYSIILPVHLMGYPNDMEKINQIAAKYDLQTFEDSAQAHGSKIGNKKTGACSLLSDFSFYIAHNIQAGEMGAVTTDDQNLYRTIKSLKANGRLCNCLICTRENGFCPYQDQDFDPRFIHSHISYNFKTMDIQAALAVTQVKKADSIFATRQKNVQELNIRLAKYQHILQLPEFRKNVSYLAYPIILKDAQKYSREKICNYLERHVVENRPLFGCIPTQQPAYNYLKNSYIDKLPNAELVGNQGFYIGCHQYLKESDFDYVLSVFDQLFQ